MLKHLAVVGNSFALVIDRPILRLLRIQRDTELQLSIDGQRLIIEPVRPVPSGADDGQRSFSERGRDAAKILKMLERDPDFHTCFAQLSEGMRVMLYEAHLENSTRGTPQVERIMARLDIWANGVRAGRPFSDLVGVALEAVPMPSKDES